MELAYFLFAGKIIVSLHILALLVYLDIVNIIFISYLQ